MGRNAIPGLVKRKGIWHVDKKIFGRRICQSTGSGCQKEAEQYLARLMEEKRQATIYGVRPVRTFEEAAAKFVIENQHKRSIGDDVSRLTGLLPWIGTIPLHAVHMGTLGPWIEHRRGQGLAAGTINHGLQITRRILNLASSEWLDENGLTWLATPPKIKLLPDRNKRRPYPLTWMEQESLFNELPDHLAEMALFAVNTGCRDREICNLQWTWEVDVPELNTSVFIIPNTQVKNGEERLVVLNSIARSVIDTRRGKHKTHVFSFKGKPLYRMLTSAWKRARQRADLGQVRVHDLKHTFGRRLRSAGVSFEDRQDLLGHHSNRMTTHYSAAELSRLLEAAETVCDRHEQQPELVVLRGFFRKTPAKVPQAQNSAPTINRQVFEKTWRSRQDSNLRPTD